MRGFLSQKRDFHASFTRSARVTSELIIVSSEQTRVSSGLIPYAIAYPETYVLHMSRHMRANKKASSLSGTIK